MARSKPVLNAVDFKNNIGQTIRPGDDVIIVTTCTSQVNIKPGKYLGKKNNGVSCRVIEYHTHYRFKETGENVQWNWPEHAKKRGTLPEYPKYEAYPIRQPKFDYSKTGGGEEYAKWREGFDAHHKVRQQLSTGYYAKYQEVLKDYEAFRVPYNRHTTLQLNRIYKIDTSVFDLSI